jgi:predicted transcriptional regulator
MYHSIYHTMQKTVMPLLTTLLFSLAVCAQDVDYKKGMISVDGNDYAKVDVKKQNFGLTKSFEVFNLAGQKIIIAAVATEFESDKNDNSFLFYRLTFLTAGQVAIFKIPALNQEKGFAKLIGNSGILIKDTVNPAKLMEFIASKSATPSIAVDYTPVARNRAWPLSIKPDKTIEQNSKIIGTFKVVAYSDALDQYEFKLPSGVTIAKVSFTGGNNAQNMELFTAKDNYKRAVPMPQADKIIAADVSIDKNLFTLRRVVKWLVDNQYL